MAHFNHETGGSISRRPDLIAAARAQNGRESSDKVLYFLWGLTGPEKFIEFLAHLSSSTKGFSVQVVGVLGAAPGLPHAG